MRFFDLLSTAFLNLWRRKLRAILTVLGLVIGITSIVVMVGLGLGIQKSTIDAYERMGSLTVIQVNPWRSSPDGKSSETKLDDKSVAAFEKIPGVTAVMPMIEIYGMLLSGKYYASTSILGVDQATAEAFDFVLEEGRYPVYRRGSKSYEIVFNSYLLDSFYNAKNYKPAVDRDGNPLVTLNSRFRLTFDWNNIWGGSDMSAMPGRIPGKYYKVEAVGKLAEGNYNYSWYSLMAKEAVLRLMKENKDFVGEIKSYNTVLVKCESSKIVADIKQRIDDMGYGTFSMLEWIDQEKQQTAVLQWVLGAIGAVSLFVAAIGIMNTMMMSIYERTKEIGIIKVLGCRMWNITMLFLTEAMLIGFFGGLFGLLLSYGVAGIVNRLIGQSLGVGSFQVIIPLYLAVGAVSFSVAVALVSGLYPAIRAMRLSALAAIRNE